MKRRAADTVKNWKYYMYQAVALALSALMAFFSKQTVALLNRLLTAAFGTDLLLAAKLLYLPVYALVILAVDRAFGRWVLDYRHADDRADEHMKGGGDDEGD